MNKLELLSLSLYNIKQHTLRTVLTIFGVVIATFIVTFFLIISDTFNYTVRIAEKMLGGDVITLDKYDWKDETHNAGELIMKRANFSYGLIKELKEQQFVILCSSVYKNKFDITINGKKLENIQIYGVEPSFFTMHNYKLSEGNFFNYIDLKENKRVCVIGYDLLKKFNKNCLEDFVYIGGVSFKIIGVLKKIGNFLEMRPDEVVIIPANTYGRYLSQENDYPRIEILPEKKDEETIESIEKIVKEKREKMGERGGFAVNTLEKRFGFFKGVGTGIFRMLFIISLISLFVGCIGVANVMIASSTERIHEIGILKAIGASDIEIFIIFILEPVLLGLLGSCIGVPLGTLLSSILLLSSRTTGFIFRFPLLSIILSITITIIATAISGLYSAYKSAKIQTIEALRYQ